MESILTKINLKYTLFILFFLMFPSKNQYLYLLGLSTLICFFMGNIKRRYSINVECKLLSILMAYILFTSAFRFLFALEPNIRDFFEAFRFLPLFCLFLFKEKIRLLSYQHIFVACFLYLSLDFSVSLLQYLQLNFFGLIDFVSYVFNNTGQFEKSFLISNRILGIAANPNDHATFMIIVTVVFLGFTHENYKITKKIIALLGIILSIINIILTQSRTGLIAIFLVIIVYSIYCLIYASKAHRVLIVTLFSAIVSFYLYYFDQIMENLYTFNYLLDFVLRGAEVSSYQLRLIKWNFFYEKMLEEPIYFIIGSGKDYFGIASGSMDSDYIYILFIYGVLAFFAFIFIVVLNYCKLFFYIRLQNNCYALPLFLLITVGFVISWVGTFFINPQVECILGIYIIKCFQVKRRVREENYDRKNKSCFLGDE